MTPRTQRNDQSNREDSCHFCPETERLERHHIVPQRFDGSDNPENIVEVCPTCHSKLERLYDKSFYDQLGVEKTPKTIVECAIDGCTADTSRTLPTMVGDEPIPVCDGHYECVVRGCDRSPIGWVEHFDKVVHRTMCERHATCRSPNCENTETLLHETWMGTLPYCYAHEPEPSDDDLGVAE